MNLSLSVAPRGNGPSNNVELNKLFTGVEAGIN